MDKYINLAAVSNGRMMGEIWVRAEGWSTRYSWGHTAEVLVDFNVVVRCKYRYYNRTWESYRFQSVLHGALSGYVQYVTGIDPHKGICKRDQSPMKSPAAETRRLARVEAYNAARELYNNLCGVVDGTITEEELLARAA